MATNNMFNDLLKTLENPYASVVEDGVPAGDVESYVDTGSYVLNGLLSGDIYGGLASNKITAFAGEPSTYKTSAILGVVKNFLDKNNKSGVIYFESESALTKQMIVERGIDVSRMMIVPVTTVQEFRHQAIKVIDKYSETPEDKRTPLMLCLDSLGMLASEKEIEDMTSGKETVDLTRARLVKGTFRVLTLKLSKAKLPLLITNHTYQSIGQMYPQQIMGSGSGLQYAASTIIFLSRKKEKDGDEVIGNIVHCKNYKNRLARENKKVDILVTYNSGLNRYYGLSEIAIEAGIFKNVSTRIELPDGTKVFEKQLNSHPEKYYTKEILDKINEYVKITFRYGRPDVPKEITEVAE